MFVRALCPGIVQSTCKKHDCNPQGLILGNPYLKKRRYYYKLPKPRLKKDADQKESEEEIITCKAAY